MRHPKFIIAGISLAAVAAAGGAAAAAAAGGPSAGSAAAGHNAAAATVRTAPATVAGTAATTAAGPGGKLTVVNDAHGHQVAYNGHLLYTFVSDHAGQVTGQGVQNFFVATPGLTPITGSPTPAGTVPAAPPANGYGY